MGAAPVPRSSAMRPALAYYGLVFGTGFALGVIRVPLLVPRLGERLAELLEMPFMLIAIVLAARFVLRRWPGPASRLHWAIVGAMALALLVATELMLAVVLAGRSVGAYLAARDPVSGSVYLVMLVVFAAMPGLLWRRGR